MPASNHALGSNRSAFTEYHWHSDAIPPRKFYRLIAEIGLRLRHLMTDPGAIRMIDVCEDCAEGRVTQFDARDRSRENQPVFSLDPWNDGHYAVDLANGLYAWVADRSKVRYRGVESAADAPAVLATMEAGVLSARVNFASVEAVRDNPVFARVRTQTEEEWGSLVRDIYEPLPSPGLRYPFDPSWRTEAVVALARGMYAARDFAAMPVLADALDDAGCGDADLLAHCRGDGPHVRGCWVVDLVLGKV